MELSKVKPKTLYIIATPIGNPKDISIRALETLKEVDFILAEDTRTLNDFLRLYGIKEKKIISYYSQNEKQKLSQVLSFFDQGSVALVSEAGTPLISDPGFLLVKACIEKKIAMTCIPGASTLTTLLPLSGFSLKEFFFKGFLSNKRGTRQNQLKKLLEIETVLIIYESPHRIFETLEDIVSIFDENTQMVVGRELTKKFETLYRGTIKQIFELSKTINFVCKGEFCIIIDNNRNKH